MITKTTGLKLTLVLLVFSFGFFPQSLTAQCTIDQNQPSYNGGTSERNQPGAYEWESFTAGFSGLLCEIDLMFCNTSTKLVGQATLKIYGGTGTAGVLLDTQTVVVNGSGYSTNTVFWQKWTITAPPFVSTGQVYTFQFIPTVGGGLTDPYLIEINIPNVYSGGHNYNLGTGGCCTFATYVDPNITSLATLSGPPKDLQVLLENIPANNELKGIIQSPQDDEVQVEIYDLQGRKLIAQSLAVVKGNNSFNFDLKNLSSGAYLIRISGSNAGQLTRRFIKM